MACNAQSNDSIAAPADYSLLPVQYIGLQTSNPAVYSDVKNDRMNGQLFYNHMSGDYKNISDPGSMNGGKIAMEGFKRVNKLHFYGSFSYDISGLKGQKWKNVLMPSEGNPFILGDSIGGSYDNETFEIKGAMASSFNEKIKWGVVVNYKGGSSADQDDPRPKIDAARYTLRPGIIYNLSSNWDIGLDFGYEGYREDISITVVEDYNTYRFMLFQGLGNYFLASGSGYSREYRGNALDGNVQVKWGKDIYGNILQLGYKSKEEKAKDGSSGSLFKAGDYKETTYSLMNIFSIKRNQTLHLVKINIDYYSSKGIWYDQRKITNENDQQIWEVYNKSVKYKDNTTKAGLEYTWLKEKQGFKDYMLGASIELDQHKTTFMPEMYLQKYSNIRASLKGGKTFWLPKKMQLGLDLKFTYQQNLSSKADFEGIVLANEWSYPRFEYLTSDYYAGEASVKLSKRTQLGNLPSIIYWTANVGYTQSNLDTEHFDKPDHIGFTTSLGFTF